MNLLFTSAGRRRYLLEYFSEALGSKAKVHAGNSDPYCAAFAWNGPKVVTPAIFDKNYIDFIYDYSVNNKIRAIIPLFDIDLPVLASARQRFAAGGIDIIVSDANVVDICNDKLKSIRFLKNNGIETLETVSSLPEALEAVKSGAISFPLIIKPRWGMGSIGIFEAENMEELCVLYNKSKNAVLRSYLRFESSVDMEHAVLIQEKAMGIEYGLDVVHNLLCVFKTVSVKRKVAMRSGETDIAVTENIPTLFELGRRVGAALGHRANLDIDLFWEGDATKAKVLELNARFGGGYPFSHLAGLDMPRAIISWLRGDTEAGGVFSVTPGIVGIKDIRPIQLSLK